MRPDFITEEDVERWQEILDQNEFISDEYKNDPTIKEVCFAGMWLFEQLQNKNCPDSLSIRIQFTTAMLFREQKNKNQSHNPWDIHQKILAKYDNNELEFSKDDAQSNN